MTGCVWRWNEFEPHPLLSVASYFSSSWPNDPTSARAPLALDILGSDSDSLDSAPEADTDNGAKGKEHTQRDAQSPDGLDFIAVRLVDGDKGNVVDGLGEDVPVGDALGLGAGNMCQACGQRRGGAFWEHFACEHRKGLADRDGHDNGGNHEGEVQPGGDNEREQAVIV